MGQLLSKAIKLIAPTTNRDTLHFEDGDTSDIISVVLMDDEVAARKRLIKDFAPLLRGATDYKTCLNIWNFVKNEIPYVADKSGYERIRLPNKTIYDAYHIQNGGDCKSFALLTNDLCRELGINSLYRFISQKRLSQKVTHVYCVAIVNGKEIYLDAVYHKFNEEAYRTYKQDYRASMIVPQSAASVKGISPRTEGYQKWI
jgi:Transglutaminase-like superfamily